MQKDYLNKIEFKVCNFCHVEKPISKFKSGYKCKRCVNLAARKRKLLQRKNPIYPLLYVLRKLIKIKKEEECIKRAKERRKFYKQEEKRLNIERYFTHEGRIKKRFNIKRNKNG